MSEAIQIVRIGVDDDFDFDNIEPLFKPVKYNGKHYMLREAKGGVVVAFRNVAMKAAKLSDAKVVGIDGLVDADIVLVAGCLFEVTPKGEGAVTPGFVKSLPNRVMKPMFEWLKKYSDIDDPADLKTLKKQHEELDKRIKLREKEAAEDTSAPKGEPNDTMHGSDSPTS